MDTFNNDIFLAKKLEKVEEKILFNVHKHYRKNRDKNLTHAELEKALSEIYLPVVNCPILEDQLVWFNAWNRKLEDKANLFFIKEEEEYPKKIISVYQFVYHDYRKYVSSLSNLASDYQTLQDGSYIAPADYSYLISLVDDSKCDIVMSSAYAQDYFVYLNFKEVVPLLDTLFDPRVDQNIIKSSGEDEVYKTIIDILRKSYHTLVYKLGNKDISQVIKSITTMLSEAWDIDISGKIKSGEIFKESDRVDGKKKPLTWREHELNIIRLINYYYWIKLAYPDNTWKVIFYLPGIISKGFDSVPLGVNIGLKEMMPLEVLLFLNRTVLQFFTRESVNFFENKVRHEIIKHGTHSAVSAIMGRNISHNLGSHVISKIISQYPQVGTTESKGISQFLDKSKDFFRYLQVRMDFVAAMTGTKAVWTLPMRFCSDVLMPFQKVVSGGYKVSNNDDTFMIQFLARSEGLGDTQKIKIYCDIDCNNNFCKNCSSDTESASEESLKDIFVAIPEGNVGIHAFYTILENYIRNSAKHSYKKKQGDLEIHISLKKDNDAKYYEVQIYDNCEIEKVDNLIQQINDKISKSIINPDGSVCDANWGISEMKLCAGYLDQKESVDVDKILISNARKTKNGLFWAEKKGEKYLSYKFKLQRPKDLIVIGHNPSNIAVDEGIYVEEEIDSKKVYTHKIMLVDNADQNVLDVIAERLPYLPARILINVKSDKNGLKSLIENKKLNDSVFVIEQFEIKDKLKAEDANSLRAIWLREFIISRTGKNSVCCYFFPEKEPLDNWQGSVLIEKLHQIAGNISAIPDIPISVKVIYKESDMVKKTTAGEDFNESSILDEKRNAAIVFDRHGDLVKTEDRCKLIHSEVLTGRLPLLSLLNTLPFDLSLYFIFPLVEAALLKILLIDERVADDLVYNGELRELNLGKSSDYKWRILKHMGIDVPYEVKVKEESGFYSDAWEPIISDSNDVVSEIFDSNNRNELTVTLDNFTEIKRYDYCLIHMGILDKWVENNIFDDISATVEFLENSFKNVVVHSGRGRPRNLPDRIKYLEFSTLQYYVIQNPSKFHLTQILFSLRGEEAGG